MKRTLLYTSTFFLVALIAIIFIRSKDETKTKNPIPGETIIVDKEDETSHLKRQEWIETMHKCAPDVNWRKQNYDIRKEKADNLRNNQKDISNGAVSIAGGLLDGYWREGGSVNLAGRTHSVEYDVIEDSIYCATSGGNIWKAAPDGTGWYSLNDNFQIPDIQMIRKIDNNGTPRLLVASGAWSIPGFYYSDDDGNNWTASTGLQGIMDWGTVVKGVVANNTGNDIYLLSREWDYVEWYGIVTVYISTNKGVTFSQIASFDEPTYGGKNNFDIWTDYYGSGDVYLLENNNVYSFDIGNNLQYLSSMSVTTPGNAMLTGCENGGLTYLYAAYYGGEYVELYRSADAGLTWQAKGNTTSNAFFKTSFGCAADDPDAVYFGGFECYRSHDGAATWTKINNWGAYYGSEIDMLHADIPGFNSFYDGSGNEFMYINTDGGTYISFDHLLNVENISMQNLNVSQYYSTYTCRFNSNYVHAGSQDQGYQLSAVDDGASPMSFEQVISGDYGHIVSGDGGASVWTVYPGSAAYFSNVNNNPYNIDWWDFTCSGQHWIPPLMADPSNPLKVYMGGGSTTTGSHIFHLTGTGSGSISIVEETFDFSGPSGDAAISFIAFSPIDPDYRYLINNNGEFFLSTDGGTTWNMTSGFSGPTGDYLYGSSIIASPVQLGLLYVGGSGYSNSPVFVSDDHGQTFTAIDNGIPNTMVYEMAITTDGTTLFAATDVGPYVYIVSQNQWYDLALGVAPEQTYWTVDYVPAIATARFGTYGRGIWDFQIDNGVDIHEKLANNIVGVEVYPNPASELLNVSLNNNSKPTNLELFNLEGQLVYSESIKNLSNSTISIDISGFASGSYYLKANTNAGIEVVKVVFR